MSPSGGMRSLWPSVDDLCPRTKGGVFELVVDRGLGAEERVQGRDLHAPRERLAGLRARTRVPCPAWNKVQQPVPRLPVLSQLRSTIPVSSLGPRVRGSRYCQMCSSASRPVTRSNLDSSASIRTSSSRTHRRRTARPIAATRFARASHRHVMQHATTAPTTRRDDPARRTSGRRRRNLDDADQ